MWRNRRNLLDERHVAAPGCPWTLEVHTWRVGALPQFAAVAIGTRELEQQLPGLGTMFVDLAAADAFVVPLGANVGEVTFTIPHSPLVLGIDVVAQAVVVGVDGLALTGPVRDRVR